MALAEPLFCRQNEQLEDDYYYVWSIPHDNGLNINTIVLVDPLGF